MNSTHSILVIGASGRTGQECLRQLAQHPAKPALHAFCRDASKMDPQDAKLCQSIVTGNARSEQDLYNALDTTNADTVIVSIGNGDDTSKTDIRTASARALVNVLTKNPQFEHVRVLVVSSTGAASSDIIVGFGIGKLISFHLRHVLADHTGQEAAFQSIQDRTVIVRPTALTDKKATGKLVEFGDKDKSPSIETDRSDLASFIVQEILGETRKFGGRAVNVTGVKK